MRLVVILLAVAVALVVFDRLLLAAEERGWIYYRKKNASPGTRASAALEIQALLEPGRTYTIEAVHREESEKDDSGEPPESGDGTAEERDQTDSPR